MYSNIYQCIHCTCIVTILSYIIHMSNVATLMYVYCHYIFCTLFSSCTRLLSWASATWTVATLFPIAFCGCMLPTGSQISSRLSCLQGNKRYVRAPHPPLGQVHANTDMQAIRHCEVIVCTCHVYIPDEASGTWMKHIITGSDIH